MKSIKLIISVLLEKLLIQEDKDIQSLVQSLVGDGKIEFKDSNSSRAVYTAKMDGAQRRKCVDVANSKIKADKNLEAVPVAPARQAKSFAFKYKDEKMVYEVQTKPDNKLTGGDPNELMTAAAVFIPNLKSAAPKTTVEMDEFIEKILKIISSGKVKDYDPSHIKLFDADYDNCAQAISAAIVIQNFIGKIPNAAYITGQKWNSDIAMFKRNSYGMKDFNSSDIVFSSGKSFFGISLKKKGIATAGDPTLLNKAFASLFDQSNPLYKDMIENLETSKQEFYYSVIQSAIKDKQIKPVSFDKKLWGKYIGLVDNDYINAKLKSDKSFFKDVYDVIDKEKAHIADYLIKLILKIDLKELLTHEFNFALVTGIGRYLPSKGPIIESGEIIKIQTLVDKMEGLFASGPITMITTPGKKQSFEADGGSAALYFTIKIGDVHCLDIVLRYKGTFSSQPNFLATMTKEFKTFLKS